MMKDKTTKQLGMIGLGRMGANMVRRLIRGGHQCVVYDRSQQTVKELVKEQAGGLVDGKRASDAVRAALARDLV